MELTNKANFTCLLAILVDRLNGRLGERFLDGGLRGRVVKVWAAAKALAANFKKEPTRCRERPLLLFLAGWFLCWTTYLWNVCVVHFCGALGFCLTGSLSPFPFHVYQITSSVYVCAILTVQNSASNFTVMWLLMEKHSWALLCNWEFL